MLSIEFIDHVKRIAGLKTTREARKWSVEVLCALFHTIAEDQTRMEFCSKLPRRLHELVQRNAHAHATYDRHSLVAAVADSLSVEQAVAERAVTTVYRGLLAILSPAEAQFFRQQLPHDLAHLLEWEESVDDAVQSTTWGFEERSHGNPGASPLLSGGDLDARWDLAESSGEETAGASVTTPDQNVVEEIGEAIGIVYASGEELRLGEKEAARDRDRWELDPASAEDFASRADRHPLKSPFVR